MAINQETTVRKITAFPRELVAAVEEFRFANRIKTESEAIRRLIELGLEAAKHNVDAASASLLWRSESESQ